MPAYIIVNIEVTDPVGYEGYKILTPSTISAYGGSFIVRGGAAEVLEGSRQPGRIVVLEFPDTDRAKEWWNSAEYAEAKLIRQRTAKTEMFVVEGLNK